MDFRRDFLNGDLNGDIYMQKSPGFISAKSTSLVCKLLKSLYDLKQALGA